MKLESVVCLMIASQSLTSRLGAEDLQPELPVVENLITRTATIELDLHPKAPEKLFRKGPCVIVLGLLSYHRESPDYVLVDFELQTQSMADQQTKPHESRWEKIDIQDSIEILQGSKEIQGLESIDKRYMDPAISMPLPLKKQGVWGELVVHPKLAEKANQEMDDVLMFRYIDFHPDQVKNRVYRVRLKVMKPGEKVGNFTPWSEVSHPAKDEDLLPK